MKRRTIRLKICGKVNLSLNILGVSGDKHVLDSVMASVDIFDTVTICERFDDRVSIEFVGEEKTNAAEKNYSVARAVELIRARAGNVGADIVIKKGIPIAGGMGGSSADAAAVICGFDLLFGLEDRGVDIAAIAAKAGSDVPFMMRGGYARVEGTGEKVTPFDGELELNMVIARGGGKVETAECFKRFDEMYADKKLILSDTDLLIKAAKDGESGQAMSQFANALALPAISLLPEIQEAFALLAGAGAEKTVMTGSGSCVVGYFLDKSSAEAAATVLQSRGLIAVTAQNAKQGIEVL